MSPMSKTTRIPGKFASPGAVNQHGGSLPLYRCNTCKREVVWAESKRTGRRYLVNASEGYHGQRFYVGADIHRCGDAAPLEDAFDKGARIAEITAQAQEAMRRGDRNEALRLVDSIGGL